MIQGVKLMSKRPPLSQLPLGRNGLNKNFTVLPQNNALNQSSRLNSKRDSRNLIGQTQVTFKDITALFSGASLGVTEAQLQDYILIKHASDSNHDNNRTVTFTLKEYMDIRGLKDAKNARNTLKKSLDILTNLQISYSGGNKSNPYNQSFGKRNIFSGYDYYRGNVSITFTPEMNAIVTQQSMPMPYHKLLLRLDPKREATSFYIFRRLLENKRMNYNQGRADRAKISNLLENCPNLPTYEEVMAGNKNVDDRIIQPFFKAVERLSEAFDYAYLTSDGHPFNYVSGLNYGTFANGELVITSWKNYPDSFLNQIGRHKADHRKRITARKQRG